MQSSGHPALNAAHVGLRRCQVVLPREQQRDVYWNALENAFFDRNYAGRSARNLDVQIGLGSATVQQRGGPDCALRVTGQQRGDFQGHPAVDTVACGVDRPEQVCGLRKILERELEEQVFSGNARPFQHTNAGVVGVTASDGRLEDRGVRGQPRYAQFCNVSRQRAALEQPAGDVIEPDALAMPGKLAGVAVHGMRACHFALRPCVEGAGARSE